MSGPRPLLIDKCGRAPRHVLRHTGRSGLTQHYLACETSLFLAELQASGTGPTVPRELA